MALACATATVTEPDLAPRPDTPREQQPAEQSWDDPLAELTRIVGRENRERGDELLALFRERGLAPQVQEFRTEATERSPSQVGRNLIATIGDGPRDIVVGAHYDVVRLQDGSVVGGAVDNGAASVVLTRVAETLAGHQLHHRVRVVLFDLEEIGLRGSSAYIVSEGDDRIAAMVNADVIAGDGTLMYGPTSHEGNDAVYRSLRVACTATGVSCMEFPRYPPSDDRSFQAAGIPNVSIGMNETVAAHQMWLVLNGGAESGLESGFMPAVFRVIHTPEDTMQHANETAMRRLHDLVVALVLELDKTLE